MKRKVGKGHIIRSGVTRKQTVFKDIYSFHWEAVRFFILQCKYLTENWAGGSLLQEEQSKANYSLFKAYYFKSETAAEGVVHFIKYAGGKQTATRS